MKRTLAGLVLIAGIGVLIACATLKAAEEKATPVAKACTIETASDFAVAFARCYQDANDDAGQAESCLIASLPMLGVDAVDCIRRHLNGQCSTGCPFPHKDAGAGPRSRAPMDGRAALWARNDLCYRPGPGARNRRKRSHGRDWSAGGSGYGAHATKVPRTPGVQASWHPAHRVG